MFNRPTHQSPLRWAFCCRLDTRRYGSGLPSLNLAKESDRAANHVLQDVKPATSEDLAEVVPWPSGDRFVTLGEFLNARTEAGCMVQGE